jgi:tetratricopeptide (TPR) repeat protein
MTPALARRAWTLFACAFLLVAIPRLAVADDVATRSAKRHFDKGEKLFALGKFDAALEEYQRAFDAKPIPAFLFNIGQCHRNLGDFDQAIFSFQKYLELSPDAANADAVRALIGDLQVKQERIAAQHAPTPATTTMIVQAPPPPPLPPTAPSTHPIYTRWWFWTGIGVLAAIGGGVAYEETRGGAPATALGNIVFGK